jgi:DNA-binding MarR family transcriptional regulator
MEATMDTTQEQLCADVMNLLDGLKNALVGIADEQGITKIQLFALYAIDLHGELVMSKAAGVLHCDPSNVTGLVDRLVGQELAVRHESLTDRRSKILRLTPKGKAVVAKLRSTLPVKLGCKKLSQDEQATLHVLIQKMSV